MSEPHFRYDSLPGWLRGNTHVHTTRSDGGKSPAEAAALYAAAGYDFICLTDHWVTSSDQAQGTDGSALLVLDGIELDGHDGQGSYYHIVCLGAFEGLQRDMGLEAALESAHRQRGFLVLAHPAWTGNSVEEALRHPFHAVEAYNHVCTWLNGKGSGLVHWDAMLEKRPNVLGLATDDAHLRAEHPGWNGGWVMVAAESRSPGGITEALRNGRFYSSCGPRIFTLEHRAGVVSCRTSPVCFARIVGPRHRGARSGGFDGVMMTEFELEIPPECAWVRLEIEDDRGRRAWTNTLFT
jgi:hypothetical protein